ncbi:PilT protein-like protein [Acetobacter tropicalis NRIC 0312]|uniref:Ribonuclease VapC n=1 Tax=Acetobacter tropicalis TaxID=104102 RepID=A0A511FSC9_9PROT|nr:type II toxin-antitoxin system VapC family toxin [Acetobacter tropicalis]KXV51113.1 twitching motility protein PilT [Acetobacter tropicalis]GAL96042.1 twitching motility protein PilT [Acetobacter tropicalis]GBR70821.1 PilT protein-like protein [Acetobacter tropicalis NRIC 0312]GEL51834.1 ribonuclease VapC [Acetobacter tropicalis]
MRGYLLDTNVISMLSPSRSEASEAFLEWLERIDGQGQLYLSVVAIHEIEKGIGLLEHKGATARAASLKIWLAGLTATYDDRILRVDASVVTVAGRLEAHALAAGHNPGMADALIAGTAKAHDLQVVTRNLKHFAPFDVAAWSPDDAVTGR